MWVPEVYGIFFGHDNIFVLDTNTKPQKDKYLSYQILNLGQLWAPSSLTLKGTPLWVFDKIIHYDPGLLDTW